MRLCPYCRNPVSGYSYECDIDYCKECELVVEGETEDLSEEDVL